MYPNHVDPEEMAMRKNLDLIASLNMIDEGCPLFPLDEEKEVEKNALRTKPPENNYH